MSFWDNLFYNKLSNYDDRNTIYRGCPETIKVTHYLSVENIIMRILLQNNMCNKNILDFGCGTGHWIQFYDDLNFDNITGIDISEKVIVQARKRFINKDNINILCGNILELDLNNKFDIINTIGTMFHIMDDKLLEDILRKFSSLLQKEGHIIIGGEFGDKIELLHFIDVNKKPIKKLRSYVFWQDILDKCGLKILKFYKNDIRKLFHTPQNNILLVTHK